MTRLVAVLAVFGCLAAFTAAAASGVAATARATDAPTPAFAFNLGINAIEYLKDQALNALLPKLQHLALPDVSGNPKVPVIGEIDFHLTHIELASFTIGACNATFAAPEGVGVVVSDLSMALTLDWQYKKKGFPWLPFGKGSANIDITGCSMNLMLTLAEDAAGHLQLASSQADVQIGKMSVKVHGSILSWIYDLLFAIFKSSIKKDIDTSIDKVLQENLVVDVNAAFAKLPTLIAVGNMTFDARLSAPPLVTKAFLQVDIQADFFLPSSPSASCPLPRHALPSSPPDRMVQLLLDDYALNSALWGLTTLGALSVTLTDATLPKGLPFHLNTNDTILSLAYPALHTRYPTGLPVELQIFAATQPVVSFGAVSASGAIGASLAVSLQTDAFVIDSTGARIQAFQTATNVSGNAAVTTNGTHLSVALNSLSCGISLIATEVGPMALTYLEDLYAIACPDVILPLINKALAKAGGIPIPSLGPNLKLANVELTMPPNGGVVAIAADLQFVSSTVVSKIDEESTPMSTTKRPHCVGAMMADVVADLLDAMAASAPLNQDDVEDVDTALDATVISA